MKMLADLYRDLVLAVRSLAKARTLTFVCVVTLGIGMAPVIAVQAWMRVFSPPARRAASVDPIVAMRSL